MPRTLITKVTYTIMPDFGFAPYAWIKRPGETVAGVGGNCACDTLWGGDHAISVELECAFSAWALEFEGAPYIAEEGRCDLDWDDFHRRGIELSCRLKAELGDVVSVIYQKSGQDPNCSHEERREVLADGNLFSLPSRKELNATRFMDMVERIVSGGQTGADRAALDWAIANQVPHGGWCPKGRLALDGVLDEKYQLEETESSGYRQRTRRNVHHSDGTLIVNLGDLDGGTLTTKRFAEKAGKPVLVVQLDAGVTRSNVREVLRWLRFHPIDTLNIAGPSEEKRPGMYVLTCQLLDQLACAENRGKLS